MLKHLYSSKSQSVQIQKIEEQYEEKVNKKKSSLINVSM